MKAGILSLLILGFVLSGCAATGTGGDFYRSGLPKHEYYVGGGVFEYRASEDGHLYLVDTFWDRILVTRPMEKGESCSIGDIEHPNLDTNRLAIYYIPVRQLPEPEVIE